MTYFSGRAVRAATLLVAALVLGGCAKDFPWLNPQEGWMKLSAPPANASEMLSANKIKEFNDLLKNRNYTPTWFQRGDEYLIYFTPGWSISSPDDCADQLFEYTDKTWIRMPQEKIHICPEA